MQKDFIKDYWENQAATHGTSHQASWGDNYMIDLEIETIANYIQNGDKVLDAGCANGYSTFRQWKSHQLKEIVGIDFSPKMIDAACALKKEMNIGDQVSFKTSDVRTLDFADNTFDVVYTTRVLINLPTWDEQVQAINECLRVTKPGGRVIFSEGFWEPLVLLNSLRALVQLPPLQEHDFNRYLKKSKFENYLSTMKLDFKTDDFSSVYYLGSRFVRELVTNPADYPGYSNPINEIFYNIEKDFSGGGFGIQQIYIVTKK